MATRSHFKQTESLTPKWRVTKGDGSLLLPQDVFSWTAKVMRNGDVIFVPPAQGNIVFDPPLPWRKSSGGYNVGLDVTDADMGGAIAGSVYVIEVYLDTSEGPIVLDATYQCLPVQGL